MRMKSRSWFLLSLLLLLAAGFFWRLGEQRRLREQPSEGATNAPARLTVWERFIRLPSVLTGKTPSREARPAAPKPPELLSLSNDPRLPFRLRNSQKKEAELFRSETAVLLRNALVETMEPVNLNIPAHLRAQGDPGSYLVQARGTIDQNFRDVLRGAGAEVVSYVPNNTYLVRASAAVAQQVRVSPRVQSVLPFEPYYKLDMTLLPLAVRREAMPADRWLNLVLFAGSHEQAKADLRALGAEVKAEQRFPFGHVVTIAPRADSLVALAQLPAVQNIEAYHSPVLMNDLSRVRLDVSMAPPTTNAPAGNWLGLTGSGVTVGLNGSGVDLAHPQLAGRTFVNAASPASDTNGHDTFIAGVIAANHSTTPTPTNGSIAGASYRGIASSAQVYPLSLYSDGYANYGNTWLITNAALATNIFIVNNSWGYPVSSYDINAALFDEAVRDSLDFRTNDQPVTHVFAAGNTGGANTGGTGGGADTIASPGTGKNVITVGASELLRSVENSTSVTNFGTNDPLANAHSDSDNQVADFSSRGNVGVGIEGSAGRFKPDLVAPGAYVASLRASTFTNVQESDAMLGSSQWRYESGTSVAAGKVSGLLALMQEFFALNFSRTNTPSMNKALLINRARTLHGAYDFAVNNPVTHQGWGIPSLSNTVPAVGAFGFLTNAGPLTRQIVIVDESNYVTNRLATGQFHAYDVTLPAGFTNTNTLKITLVWTDPAGNPVASTKLVNDLDLFVAATNAVSTNHYEGNNFAPGTLLTQPTPVGNSSARDSVNNVENVFISNITLPATTTHRVYVIGRKVNVNAVGADTNNVVQDYSLVISSDTPTLNVTVRPVAGAGFFAYTNRLVNTVTNGIPYLNERVGANFQQVTVNTNGVTNQWNFYVFTNQNLPPTLTNFVTNVVGGVTNIATNVVRVPITNGGPYAAFATFLPPNLARARNREADIDLFIARSGGPAPVPGASGLTNLNPAVLSHANLLRSTNRGGYELISLADAVLNEVFYVGIKSEDKQAASYGFFAAAQQQPFGTNDTNGNITMTLFPAPADIPDGTPEGPGGVTLYAICTESIILRSISMSNTFVHENLGDLVGTLSHNSTFITLNNHAVGPGTNAPAPGLQTNNLFYDDFRNPPDGPGDVTDLLGQDGVGLWIFEVQDSSPFLTGRVEYASIYLTPYTNYAVTGNTYTVTFPLQSGQSRVDFLDIPPYATNLDVDITGGLPPGPVAAGQGVDLFAGYQFVPAQSNYSDARLDLDATDLLPHLRISATTGATNGAGVTATGSGGAASFLQPGRWNFRVVNNTAGLLNLTVRYTLNYNLAVANNELYLTNSRVDLLDVYTTNLFFNVPEDRVIAGVDVGLAIYHPRISDLVIHLISPLGTKVLLFEDRGGLNGLTSANLFANFTENTNFTTSVDVNGLAPLGFVHLDYLLPIKFVPTPYSAVITPPRLMTNMTNTAFGYSNTFGLSHESPGGLAQYGQALFMAGSVLRTDGTPERTNDAFVAAYQIPITTNLNTTNWGITNYWMGPFSGYRGRGAGALNSASTIFSGVAANADGVYAGGHTLNYFPPTQQTWTGTEATRTFDVDLGSTNGSVQLTHISDAVRDRVVMQYQGLTVFDSTSLTLPAGPVNYIVTVPFSGASRFMRVTVNPTPLVPASTWTNSVTVLRSGGMEHAVVNFVRNDTSPSGFRMPATPPAYVAPAPQTLSVPRGVAMDATGNVYVADSGNNRILRFSQHMPIFLASTNGLYSPLPSIIGGVAGVLNNPGGVAVHPNGEIYVADTGNNQIRRFDASGVEITPPWGDALKTAGSENSGAVGFPNGRLNAPEGIAIGSDGIVYVADTGNSLIRVINGAALSTITMPPAFVTASGDLSGPRALAVQIRSDVLSANPLISQDISQSARLGSSLISPTTLYIADTANHRIVQLMQSGATWVAIHLAGAAVVPGPPTSGLVDGANTTARFSSPSGITRDGYGNLYVADAGTHLIRRVTPLGDVTTIVGDTAAGSSGTVNANNVAGLSARLNTPRGLVADHFGGLFVADSVNNDIRSVMPYQKVAPTNAFLSVLPFTGPATNQPVIGTSSMLFTRGITNSVFGVDLAEPHLGNHDFFTGVASSTERGSTGQATNFLYAVGSAQFSTDLASLGYQRMFISKLDTNGLPVWTRGHMPAASIALTLNAALDITSFVIGSGGSGYAAAPVATLLDPLNPNPALRSISLTLSVAGGVVTGVTAPAMPITGPFVAPRVYVEAPQTLHMPGNGVAVAYGTNVIAAGYTNQATAALLTNNLPFLMCLDSNGVPRWATNSATGGHYNSVSVFGTNIIAVGAAYAAGAVGASNCLIERWDLNGNFQTSRVHTFVGGPSQLSSVLAIESLDRAYAVGTVGINPTTSDAILMELDLVNLTVISAVTNNLNSGVNVGKAIATDGADLYVAVSGPGDGTPADAQAGIFRYRAKNFYLPEESLDAFAGQRTWAPTSLYSNGVPVLGTNTNWRLQIADTRAGGNSGIAQVLAWNLNFYYAPTSTVSLAVAPAVNNNFILLSTQPKYLMVNVPSAAAAATNLITATAPVRVTFNPTSAPLPGTPGNVEMFSGAATGSFIVSANSNAVARLRSGAQYYLRIEAMNPGPNVDVTFTVNFDQTELPPPVTPLTSGTSVNGAIPRTATLNHYAFNVAAGSSAALFEILSANGDVNLYLRRSNDAASFPSAAAFDYRSANPGTGVEQIFLVTNGASATALTPGIWFASVQNADNSPVNYTIRATTAGGTPYNVVTTVDGQLQNSVTSPGNAPNTLFKLNVPSAQKALLFEVRGLTGPGDLVVRKNGFPLTSTYDGANFRPATLSEIVTLRTNASQPSLVGDWYFGVLNPGASHIAYTVMARQPTNGVLLSGSPIQIVGPPGGGLVTTGTNFGFNLDVVPGEKYQVQYRTNLASGTWLVLTNIVAPADGVINFLHSGALSNRNLYYRIQVVP